MAFRKNEQQLFRLLIIVGICFWFIAVLLLTQIAKEKYELNQPLAGPVSLARTIPKNNDDSDKKTKDTFKLNETAKNNDANRMQETNSIHAEHPKFVLIVDDMGRDKESLDELSKLNLPLTISILPFQKYSREAANYAKKNGWEVMLHMPMEPLNVRENDPGEAALLADMPEDKMRATISELFQSLPYLKGFNNHMGSRLTAMRDKMEIVMSEAKKNNIFFIDSMTTEKSVAFEVAMNLGVPAAARTLFLDNVQNEELIAEKLKNAIEIVEKKGFAIALCHAYPETIRVLSRYSSIVGNRDTHLVHASEIIYSQENKVFLAHLITNP